MPVREYEVGRIGLIISYCNMPPHHQYGRTALEKWQICQARKVPGQRPGEMTLEEFCKLFPNSKGDAMPLSTMSTILKQSTQLLMSGKAPEGASAVKMKQRPELLRGC